MESLAFWINSIWKCFKSSFITSRFISYAFSTWYTRETFSSIKFYMFLSFSCHKSKSTLYSFEIIFIFLMLKYFDKASVNCPFFNESADLALPNNLLPPPFFSYPWIYLLCKKSKYNKHAKMPRFWAHSKANTRSSFWIKHRLCKLENYAAS